MLDDYSSDSLADKRLEITFLKKKYLRDVCTHLLQDNFTRNLGKSEAQTVELFKKKLRNERINRQHWERAVKKMPERVMSSDFILETLEIDQESNEYKIFNRITEDFFRWMLNYEDRTKSIEL